MSLNRADEYKSPFPNPWQYLDVPKEDMRDLMQLFTHTYLQDFDTLPKVFDKLTYHPDSAIAKAYPVSQSHDATHAAMFFLVCDFVAMKYARFHPKFKMKPIPQAVLNYLCPPYCMMTSLDIEDQRRFRATLPPEQQEAVYIDD